MNTKNHLGVLPQLNLCFLARGKMKRYQFCEVMGCFNCQQAQFLNAPVLETGQTRHFYGLKKLREKRSDYEQSPIMFFYSVPIKKTLLLILEGELAM